MSKPWKNWIPGVLSREQVQELCEKGLITGIDNYDNEDPDINPIDHSAIDLTLTSTAYKMIQGSVKPFGPLYHKILKNPLTSVLEPENDNSFILETRKTYLFKIKEKIHLKKESKIYGQATAKSSVGRMDVLARLVVDGMKHYEEFDPDGLDSGTGEMYLEITPMTFNIRVKEGIKLSQLRLFRGAPKISEVTGIELYESVLHNNEGIEPDGSLRVDLENIEISGNKACAFCANRMNKEGEPINLWNSDNKPLPCQYWKFKQSNQDKRLKIEKTHFYILRSKEMLSLPESIAVYCRASDETIGEMRIHYAGFAHPFFGVGRTKDDKPGTPLIFEVRGHDVDVNLTNGEKMANLIFYRMSKPAKQLNNKKSKSDPYNEQTLQLSKYFSDWPNKIEVADDGSVKEVK